jgi:hypothetical protein
MSDIELPTLTVKTPGSEFTLRCHAAAWSKEYGSEIRRKRRRYGSHYPGLLMLSATGADTAAKAVRAILYAPEVEAGFLFDGEDVSARVAKASGGGEGRTAYKVVLARLAPGVVHLVALASVPGLMPVVDEDHVWTELSGPRYSTPLLRSWVPALLKTLLQSESIVLAQGFGQSIGVLRTEPDELDAVVGLAVKTGQVKMETNEE